MFASISEMASVGSAAQAQHCQSRTCTLQLESSKSFLQQEDEDGGRGRSSLCEARAVLAEQEAAVPAPTSGTHYLVLQCRRDTVTILASLAAPCALCGSLSCGQQMIGVDAGSPGDALWLVACGSLRTPLQTVALSLMQLQGTDPADTSQLRLPGPPCLDVSDVEIKDPQDWKHPAEGMQAQSSILFCSLSISLTLLCGGRTHTEK